MTDRATPDARLMENFGRPAYAVCRCGHWQMEHDHATGKCPVENPDSYWRFYEFRWEIPGGGLPQVEAACPPDEAWAQVTPKAYPAHGSGFIWFYEVATVDAARATTEAAHRAEVARLTTGLTEARARLQARDEA